MQKLTIINEVKSFVLSHPEMSFSECIYSFYREKLSGFKEIKDIKNISDNTVLTQIEKAKEIEDGE